jgi:hypothetical protein
MITALILAAAAVYLFWPAGKQPADVGKALADQIASMTAPAVAPEWVVPAAPPAPPAAPAAPAARDAIDSLLEVRDRLAATDTLDEESTKAVDVLWLDLLHGSARK